jgi:ABC-2 type transport system ATP-binding protein
MITASGLTKRFGKALAVHDLSFDVVPGVVTGFLGPNGAGKSTTMRMIVGLDIPNEGTALINGKRYAELDWPLREVGALLDAKAFHLARRAIDHLRYLAATNDIPARRVSEVLDIVGLGSVARQRAGRFSLGMSQRLGIASALLGDPGVLLFDEPINGLDPEGIRWVRHLLRDLAAEGRTVFVSSHLISEMALTAQRLVVIGRGRLITETSVQEFTGQCTADRVRVVSPMADALLAALRRAGADVNLEVDGAVTVSGMTSADVGRLAAHRAITLHELSPLRASLEDAFMELTRDQVEFRSGNPQPAMAGTSSGGMERGERA